MAQKKRLEAVQQLYDSALTELFEYLTAELKAGTFSKSDMKKRAEVIQHVEQITEKLNNFVQHEIEQVVADLFSSKFTGKYYLNNPEIYQNYLRVSESKIKYLSGATMGDLLQATTQTEMRLKQIIREVFTEHTAAEIIAGKGVQETVNDIATFLADKGLNTVITEYGFVGIVDAAGKKWDLQRYVDMVIRTKLAEADIETERAMGLAEGIDLAWISHHGAKDGCSKWEHVLISMNGATNLPIMTYEQVKATKECFHPNCQHHINKVRKLELLHADIIAATNKKYGINLRDYMNKQ